MAKKHILSVEVFDSNDPKLFVITDTSTYATGLDADCLRLDILPPGFSDYIYITELEKNFTKTIDSIALELQAEEEDRANLVDGVYYIKYSLSPNETKYVEYYHLRTANTLNDYYAELCKLKLDKCEPDAKTAQKMKDLRLIKVYIDAAKAKVEYCHAPNEGTDMLIYAMKMLSKYRTNCCINC